MTTADVWFILFFAVPITLLLFVRASEIDWPADRLKVSQWFPWRWLFWRRVTCHTFENGRCCKVPASIKCVYGDFSAPESEWNGYNFARDPLCTRHGKLGQCPFETRHTYRGRVFESRHLPIPRSQQWRRVHFRIRIGWEG